MLYDVNINLWATLAAAFAHMILGSLWYGPFFGKAWMKSIGKDPNVPIDDKMKKEGQKAMMMVMPASLLTAYILAHFIDFTASVTALEGAQTGFWIWLGFQATLIFQYVLFEGKKKMTALINASNQLVGFMLMGEILAVWA